MKDFTIWFKSQVYFSRPTFLLKRSVQTVFSNIISVQDTGHFIYVLEYSESTCILGMLLFRNIYVYDYRQRQSVFLGMLEHK